MNATSKAILFAFFLFVLTVEARSKDSRHDESLTSEVEEEPNDRGRMARANRERSHRRKRYQHYSNYYPSRSYQDPYQESLFEAFEQQQTQREILRKLDEILIYLRQPPPPPPPRVVYVRYPTPCSCNCNNNKRPVNVPSGGVPPRFPSMEDTNQNWGATDDDEYQELEFNRPLDFNEVKRSTASPAVNNNPVTQAPRQPDASEGNCHAATLRCCYLQERKQVLKCFSDRNCQSSSLCTQQSLDAAINYFSKTYGKVQP